MDSKTDQDMDTEEASVLTETSGLIEAKKFKEAIQALTDWIDENGPNQEGNKMVDKRLIAKVYNSRGHAKYMQVNFDGALEDYNESLKHDGNYSYAYYNRGMIAYRMGNFVDAEADMKTACKLNTSSSEEFKLALSRCTEQIKVEPEQGS